MTMLWLLMVYDSPIQLARYMLLVKRPPVTAYSLRVWGTEGRV
jgi:hypothetical protein